MPTYQYSCNDCGHFFEVFQSFSDDSLTVCPECGGRLRKVFNAVGVVFKGSGFYRTDSRSPAANPAANPAASPAASTESAGAKSSGDTDTSASGGSSSSNGAPSAGTKSPSSPSSTSAAS